ncbi:Nucleolar protein 9 [Monascus purpureus]|uniref:Nucleolar protein 9 n=1 Tax=Monascus purpureus TaxID=5098 RepID=A0A507QVH8_MONPU|nr:Nucleolar protein 9 [Monascus purpureus]BDD57012.1 Nucleolar protein 9 [Monascus purpureus]
MPREKQKRGRRAEDKAKKEEAKRKRDEGTEAPAAKRQKYSTDETNDFNENADYIPLDAGEGDINDNRNEQSTDTPFYGLLDTEEQEYFSRANELLELNQFGDVEERRLFVDSVYKEASGKELKIACSQSCSRLMEKLISMSNVHQIRRLFDKFIGHFLHLVQHRFASHCCETLFIHAAPLVNQKTSKSKGKKKPQSDGYEEEEAEPEPELSLEEMFIKVVEELQENWGYLLTERFASHTIRVLLLVLAGEPVDLSSADSVVASRKKEKLGLPDLEAQSENAITQKRDVPQSFEATLKKIIKDMVCVLDDTYLRALATHPVGNPVLQVLLYLELHHFGKSSAKESNSITKRLLPDDSLEEGSSSAIFVRGLFYDPVGSHLLETIVRWCPGKLFKNLYKNFIHGNIRSFARNLTAGYVVVRVLERLGKDDLQNAMELILPELPSLVERSRLIIPKVLIERCMVRDVDTRPLAKALEAAHDKDPAKRLAQMLKLDNSRSMDKEKESPEQGDQQTSTKPSSNNAEKLHASLLVQTMLTVPGPISELIFTSLLAQPVDSLLSISKDPTASHVLQQALTLPTSTLQFRRQFTSRFLGHLKELALDSSGSHVVDALWPATKDIFFVKERMAQELVQDELTLRDSFVGRAVWRNWSMDLYKRRRGEWAARAKGLNQLPSNDRDLNNNTNNSGNVGQRPKSRIDLARERFAANAAGNDVKGKTSKPRTQNPVVLKS